MKKKGKNWRVDGINGAIVFKTKKALWTRKITWLTPIKR
jgi:hypothetical protein